MAAARGLVLEHVAVKRKTHAPASMNHPPLARMRNSDTKLRLATAFKKIDGATHALTSARDALSDLDQEHMTSKAIRLQAKRVGLPVRQMDELVEERGNAAACGGYEEGDCPHAHEIPSKRALQDRAWREATLRQPEQEAAIRAYMWR